ncbi:hypothetical protein G6F64_014066 [Rhizopus arrhizus]|uniref:Uncharacterized protein n=1 Tax=Rhizopus oryzae TaxID=64495 RepID=A0A9P6WU55_RHIOR|nr:hypothetical protein G6F64_014066 [Rhizopus arrhizus]
MPKTLPSDVQNIIKALLEDRVDPTVVEKRVGVHRNTVNRYANKWMHNRIRKSGDKPSIVAKSTRRYIKRQVFAGCLETAKDVQMKLEELRHPVVSQHTLNMIHIQFIRNQSSECFYKDLLQSFLYYSVITNSTPLTQYKLF